MSPISQTKSSASTSDALLTELIDEVSARLEAGEPVDLDAFIAAHPERAEALRKVLPALSVLADLGRSAAGDLDAGLTSPRPDADSLGELGDYRILREIGRGGMGVVYEATQISLNRRVALKVLPFAGALDAQHLARFRLEAQAAAQLHHTNIVPVFAVGTQRGVHYYAMQFIEGKTLAQLIRELRIAQGLNEPAQTGSCEFSPTLASRLASGEMAPAEPLPSPLAGDAESPGCAGGGPQGRMRGAPAPGGAAGKPAAAPVASTPTHTRVFFRTVANLGVQAAEALEYAHRFGILHRDIKPANLLVDVHGNLWVTDFGLARFGDDASLTMTGDLLGTLRYMSPEQALGHPAVIDQRSDVYGLGVTLYELLTLQPAFDGRDRQEILRKIAFEDPRSLRKPNSAVPIELETIVLKAIAKEPASRYCSAQELADDLRRFLEHKPLRAKRPTLLERVAKWGRRHTAMVTSIIAVLTIMVFALLVNSILVRREQLRTAAALKLAESRSHEARAAVDAMYTKVAEAWISQQPFLEPVQREFLVAAAQFYTTFGLEPGSDPQLVRETALASYRLGQIEFKLGRNVQAGTAFRRAIDVQEARAREFPDDVLIRKELVKSLQAMARVVDQLSRPGEGESIHKKAVDLSEALARLYPDDREILRDLAIGYAGLCVFYADQGWHQDARPLLLRALRIREALAARENAELEDRIHLANSYGTLSALLRKTGELAAAEAPGRSSVAIFEALANEHRGQPLYKYQLANGLNGLSHQLWLMGQRDEATMVMNRALELAERVATESPEVPDYRHRVADLYGSQAEFFWENGRYPDAIQARRKSLDQHVLLESKHPERDYEKHIAQSERFLAMMLAGCPDPQFREPAEAMRLAQTAVDILPSGGNSWCALGEARYRAHKWEGAVEALEKSLTLDAPEVAGRAWILMAMANCRRRRLDEAYRCYQRARVVMNKPDSVDNQPRRFRHGVDRHLNLFFRPESASRELAQLQAEAESLLRLADQGIEQLPKR